VGQRDQQESLTVWVRPGVAGGIGARKGWEQQQAVHCTVVRARCHPKGRTRIEVLGSGIGVPRGSIGIAPRWLSAEQQAEHAVVCVSTGWAAGGAATHIEGACISNTMHSSTFARPRLHMLLLLLALLLQVRVL
jgi:hypothetical protein